MRWHGGFAATTLRPVEYPTILDLVGNTPLVRLQSVGAELKPLLLANSVHESRRLGEGPDRPGDDTRRGSMAGRSARRSVAGRKKEEILARHSPEPLAEDFDRELDEIVSAAKRELGTDG